MGNHRTDSDEVWKALADATRRAILDALCDGPLQTSEIVDRFPHLSRFGVMKHIEVLRDADLITTRISGRRRINSLNVAPLRQAIERWISKYEAYWANTLLRVEESSTREQKKGKKAKRKPA